MDKIEIFRTIISSKMLINDNRGQHYKIHASKLRNLTTITQNIIDGNNDIQNCEFNMPNKEDVIKLCDVNNGKFKLILEHWKCQRKFDLANYSMTFKPIIDVFIKNEFFKDDNWSYASKIVLTGGDFSVWDSRTKIENDKLPNDIKKDFWLSKNSELNDSLLRIIISSDLN